MVAALVAAGYRPAVYRNLEAGKLYQLTFRLPLHNSGKLFTQRWPEKTEVFDPFDFLPPVLSQRCA